MQQQARVILSFVNNRTDAWKTDVNTCEKSRVKSQQRRYMYTCIVYNHIQCILICLLQLCTTHLFTGENLLKDYLSCTFNNSRHSLPPTVNKPLTGVRWWKHHLHVKWELKNLIYISSALKSFLLALKAHMKLTETFFLCAHTCTLWRWLSTHDLIIKITEVHMKVFCVIHGGIRRLMKLHEVESELYWNNWEHSCKWYNL